MVKVRLINFNGGSRMQVIPRCRVHYPILRIRLSNGFFNDTGVGNRSSLKHLLGLKQKFTLPSIFEALLTMAPFLVLLPIGLTLIRI